MSKLVSVLLFWVLASVLVACSATPTVPEGWVYFYRNPDYIPQNIGVTTQYELYDPSNEEHVSAIQMRFSELWRESEVFVEAANLPVLKSEYAKVGNLELGLIDNFILPPGNYYNIPKVDVSIVNSVVVQETNFGILRTAQGEVYELLRPGMHRALAQDVRYFPSVPQRYRLISSDLLERTARGEIDACQSALCETSLSGVITADPAVRATVDLEVNFELVFGEEQSNLSRLFALRNIETILTTYLSSPIRSQGRALWGNITPAEMQTSDGWSKMANALRVMLEGDENTTGILEGQPIRIISVGIRGVELPESYINSQSQGVAAEQELEAQMRVAQRMQNATATASAFARQQSALEAEDIAARMLLIREALNSDDPVVMCGILNFFKPGSCSFPMPVSVSVGESN